MGDWSFNQRGGYDGWCARGAGGSLTPEAVDAAREIVWGRGPAQTEAERARVDEYVREQQEARARTEVWDAETDRLVREALPILAVPDGTTLRDAADFGAHGVYVVGNCGTVICIVGRSREGWTRSGRGGFPSLAEAISSDVTAS